MKFILCPLLLPAALVASSYAQTFRILHTFGGSPDGAGPQSLIRDQTGNLYGTTFVGGAFGNGAVFKVSPAGHEGVLYSFGPLPDGARPQAALITDAAHNFYGTTSAGGAFGNGTVFKVDASGNESILYSFAGGEDGIMPTGSLLRDASGNLYGTTVSGGGSCDCGTVFKLDPSGVETVLYRFTGEPDGAQPKGALIGDSQGNLYGTTFYGGNPFVPETACFSGCGTVFKLDGHGHETVLYRFASKPGDGTQPAGNLLRDAVGNLYGTTFYGGIHNGAVSEGMGTVFKLDPLGRETVLYSFQGISAGDGEFATAGVVRDTAGNFYGTTLSGGAPPGKHRQQGTVFKLDTAGVETVLYTFTGVQDGGGPMTSLVLDGAGDLYGTVPGGTGKSGLVFEITP